MVQQMNTPVKKKILLIRMLGLGDTLSIGVPALRFFKHKYPDAEMHFLTFAEGRDTIALAEPVVTLHSLAKEQWPDDFLAAMEVFLGLAEDIIGHEYQQIVNLDTAFMPCFLARFLKDAGEPLSGNLLSCSVQQLLEQFQSQTLQAEYVNDVSQYMDSTYFTMARWYTRWWEGRFLPDFGYPEYYLRSCCGYSDLEMDLAINVAPDRKLLKQAKGKKVIGLCLAQSDDGYLYPHGQQLKGALERLGFFVWSDYEHSYTARQTLGKMAASDLVVNKASAKHWYATAVKCPTLLITASAEPKTLMPDYATEQHSLCPVHGANHSLNFAQKCLCDKPGDLAESIESIFEQSEDCVNKQVDSHD